MGAKIKIKNTHFKSSLKLKKVNVLYYKLEFPYIISEIMAKKYDRINQYYKEKAKRTLDHINTNLYIKAKSDLRKNIFNDFLIYKVYSNANVETLSNDILSINSNYHENMGESYRKILKTSETWNLKTGKRIKLTDLFKEDEDYIKKIVIEIQKEILKNKDIYYPNAIGLAEKYFNLNNFYFKNNKLVVYYQMYRIAQRTERILEFEINGFDIDEKSLKYI